MSDLSVQDLERLGSNQDDVRHLILTAPEFVSIAEQTRREEDQAFELASANSKVSQNPNNEAETTTAQLELKLAEMKNQLDRLTQLQ